MKSWKWKLGLPIIFISFLIIGKYILWDFPVSSGKRVGNLTKISKKGKFIPTWEGTIDEGSGDKLTSYFSVQDNKIGEELYNFEGRQVILYYEQYILGWPRDTNYNIIAWKPKKPESEVSYESGSGQEALNLLSKTLFCSLLGTLISNQELYEQVKEHVKKNNLYLYNSFEKCNE